MAQASFPPQLSILPLSKFINSLHETWLWLRLVMCSTVWWKCQSEWHLCIYLLSKCMNRPIWHAWIALPVLCTWWRYINVTSLIDCDVFWRTRRRLVVSGVKWRPWAVCFPVSSLQDLIHLQVLAVQVSQDFSQVLLVTEAQITL